MQAYLFELKIHLPKNHSQILNRHLNLTWEKLFTFWESNFHYYIRYCSFPGTIVPFSYCFTHKITQVTAGNKWLTCDSLKVTCGVEKWINFG